jgi:hypothetical protein
MRAIEQRSHFRSNWPKQRGIAAVEFAFVAIIFFLVFFGVVEVARAMYVCNTLQEVTRRAAALAATTDFSNATAMQVVREKAIFRTSPGFLVFAEPIADGNVKIDYMWIQRSGTSMTMLPIPSGSLPASPAANYANCLNDPYSQSCIRLVRVRVCQADDGQSCTPVTYRTMVSLVPLPFSLPPSTTIVNAETLGMPAGVPPEPCGCT